MHGERYHGRKKGVSFLSGSAAFLSGRPKWSQACIIRHPGFGRPTKLKNAIGKMEVAQKRSDLLEVMIGVMQTTA